MTTALENQMPDPAVMRFQSVMGDGVCADYYWIQQTAGKPVEWLLTHNLTDDTWSAIVDPRGEDIDASQAQLDALHGCLTEEQKADAAEEAKEYKEWREQREAAACSMRGMR